MQCRVRPLCVPAPSTGSPPLPGRPLRPGRYLPVGRPGRNRTEGRPSGPSGVTRAATR